MVERGAEAFPNTNGSDSPDSSVTKGSCQRAKFLDPFGTVLAEYEGGVMTSSVRDKPACIWHCEGQFTGVFHLLKEVSAQSSAWPG
jgi:hypothetical protein